MRSLLIGLALLPTLYTAAQKERSLEELQDIAAQRPRYKTLTEKKDSLWHRQLLYPAKNTLAQDAWYKDKGFRILHGPFTTFHPNGKPEQIGTHVNGQRQDAWLEYYRNGRRKDSASYVDGKVRGVRLQWHDNGQLADSSEFDWAGNGVQVSWYPNGAVSVAGLWMKDTVRRGRWKYYFPNGQVRAVQEYTDGKVTAAACYDEDGTPLTDCENREATFAGGIDDWKQYLGRNLDASVPLKQKAPPGTYRVRVSFNVAEDGSLTDIQAKTRHGYGMEEEVIRIMKTCPRWSPAKEFGKRIAMQRTQSVSFVVDKPSPFDPKPKDPLTEL